MAGWADRFPWQGCSIVAHCRFLARLAQQPTGRRNGVDWLNPRYLVFARSCCASGRSAISLARFLRRFPAGFPSRPFWRRSLTSRLRSSSRRISRRPFLFRVLRLPLASKQHACFAECEQRRSAGPSWNRKQGRRTRARCRPRTAHSPLAAPHPLSRHDRRHPRRCSRCPFVSAIFSRIDLYLPMTPPKD